jgi:hypothetical protein
MILDEIRKLAAALPETTEEPHFDYTSFRVGGKIFATAPPEGEYLHVFVGDEERERALLAEPDFLEPLRWGRQVRGLRVLLSAAKPQVVKILLGQAWSRRAPKRLLAPGKSAGRSAGSSSSPRKAPHR